VRVVICWTEISGYTAACWRGLAARPDVELLVLAWPSKISRSGTQFERSLMDGLPVRFLEDHEQQDQALVANLVAAHRPDVVLTGGWYELPYRNLVWDDRLARARIVLGMDTAWRGTLRQWLARLKIGRYVDRLDGIFVPGQLGQCFARHLRMPADRVFPGLLAFDDQLVTGLYDRRAAEAPWPRRFLYLGRYAVQKSLDVLAGAYDQYRRAAPDPWPLACFGSGPMRHQIEGHPGIEVYGWAQPHEQPDILARHGVSVLASNHEPWGLAVAEAMGAGLPVICTQAVGAAADLVRPQQTGLIVPTGDAAALAGAMRWMHDHADRLPDLGRAARDAARPFAASLWPQRFVDMAQALQSMPPRR
jgi:glycosyltransferase involved in cell wall biosynthesis